ncbi:hypothetical protein CGZ91_00320 [Parenemella sanctibonifatiensis]|uniref:DUF4192 domain-containing protein n=2 Tax=Parenemella sanctibonifatiensis TaxID=2016505 RepID=A0A255EV45_9ACTN|nr:hypothetical protein CGZ91_00320 [Parenemella sanctibonifatiensis]
MGEGMTTPARLRVAGPHEVVPLIPLILGFHPDNCVVAVLLGPEGVMAMRFPPESDLAERIDYVERMATSEHCEIVVIGGFGDGMDGAAAVLFLGLTNLAAAAFSIEGEQWELVGTNMPEVPESGPYQPAGIEGVADLADVMPSREASVAAATPGCLVTDEQEAEDLWHQARDYWQDRPRAERMAQLLWILDDFEADTWVLSGAEAAELTVLISDKAVRDLPVVRLTTDTAETYLDLWGQVAQLVPAGQAADALCLVALSGWLTGNGALANDALESCLAHHPHHELAGLLWQAEMFQTPPRTWEQQRHEIAASMFARAAHQ